GMEMRIGDRLVTVQDALCAFRRHEIRTSPRLLRYRSAARWLPCSQESYERYRSMAPAERAAELDRLAVAGLLIGMRGLGVEFPDRLYAGFEHHSRGACRYKGGDLIGF